MLDVVELSRLQFAVVTIYHYFFVPMSIGLAAVTAGLHTGWWRTGKEHYRHLTLLVGKILIVTFAVGVVTGLVQEFQFGLSWSEFSRFYGDVFGPTLAIEGMLAFFLEATFLGLWFFGWDRLRPGLHLATIWIVAVGTVLSAFVIMAANSFMQNPVAYRVNAETGRAELASFGDLMVNEVNLAAFPHTIAGAAMTAGALVLAIGAWRAWGKNASVTDADHPSWRFLARTGGWITLISGVAVMITGDVLGKVMTRVQPMKMAVAEALFHTQTGAPFSIFAVGGTDGREPFFSLDVPYLLSVLAAGDPGAEVQGINDLQAQYAQVYGPGNYIPWVPVAYWTFRLMIGAGVLAAVIAAAFLWLTRKNRTLPTDKPAGVWLLRSLPIVPLLPHAANTFGWIFTETARQPWLAFGEFLTVDGVSPGLTGAEVTASLIGFTVLYGVLAVVWIRLVLYLIRQDLSPHPVPPDAPGELDTTRTAPSY